MYETLHNLVGRGMKCLCKCTLTEVRKWTHSDSSQREKAGVYCRCDSCNWYNTFPW